MKLSLILEEDSAETYLCLIEVAIEVVWFELKENATETKLRKMRHKKGNVTLTYLKMKRLHRKLNTRTTPMTQT